MAAARSVGALNYAGPLFRITALAGRAMMIRKPTLGRQRATMPPLIRQSWFRRAVKPGLSTFVVYLYL